LSRLLIIIFVVIIVMIAGVFWLRPNETPLVAPVNIARALASDTVGYARAMAPHRFSFPADHGPHPDFKNEWWYFTGNLATPSGRRFGYEWTVFRFAVTPPDSAVQTRTSHWATRQLYMAHFAVTDVYGGHFESFERFSRGAVGLAGARADPFRVWLEDWRVAASDESMPAMTIQAREGETAIGLTLRPVKPLVLQGDRGLDRKGEGLGNASYYYSMTRLETKGAITVNGKSYEAEGLSWMDREWSTSALDDGQVGWDWFALQRTDGRELMYYQLRNRDGSISETSGGMQVDPQGTARRLKHAGVNLTVLARWKSPHSGAEYPARWRFRTESLDLTVTPLIADQELSGTVRYWEGAVRFEGTDAGAAISGFGYVELTGYEESGVVPGS